MQLKGYSVIEHQCTLTRQDYATERAEFSAYFGRKPSQRSSALRSSGGDLNSISASGSVCTPHSSFPSYRHIRRLPSTVRTPSKLAFASAEDYRFSVFFSVVPFRVRLRSVVECAFRSLVETSYRCSWNDVSASSPCMEYALTCRHTQFVEIWTQVATTRCVVGRPVISRGLTVPRVPAQFIEIWRQNIPSPKDAIVRCVLTAATRSRLTCQRSRGTAPRQKQQSLNLSRTGFRFLRGAVGRIDGGDDPRCVVLFGIIRG